MGRKALLNRFREDYQNRVGEDELVNSKYSLINIEISDNIEDYIYFKDLLHIEFYCKTLTFYDDKYEDHILFFKDHINNIKNKYEVWQDYICAINSNSDDIITDKLDVTCDKILFYIEYFENRLYQLLYNKLKETL